MHDVDIYFPPSFLGLPNVQYLIEYRCISWGVASFLEGKIRGLCLVQLCKIQASKHYVESLPFVLKDKKAASLRGKKPAVQLLFACALALWK